MPGSRSPDGSTNKGGLAPAARFATAPPPISAGSLRSRSSASLSSFGDDADVDAELLAKGALPPRLASPVHGGLVRPPRLASRPLPLRAPPPPFGRARFARVVRHSL